MAKVLRALPDKISSDFFQAYYFCSIDKGEAENTGVIIDDGLFEIKFIKEKNISMVVRGHETKLPLTTMIGKIGVQSRIKVPERLNFLTIKIQPWASSFFLDENFDSITDISKNNRFPKIHQLHEKIFKTDNFTEQIEHVENYFLGDNLPDLSNYETTKRICNLIYSSNGNIKVADIIEKLPYSRQKINRLFFHQTKYSIKEFSLLTRLRAIMSHYVCSPEKSLTELSYEFGYFDQPHFIRDMKRLTGISPLKFTKSKNLFFQQLKKST